VVPQMLDDVAAHIDRWQPDIILSNEYERSGCALAEQRRIPFVLASSGPRLPRELRRQWHAPLYNDARRALGLPLDLSLDYALRWLQLSFMPVEYFFSSGVAYQPAANEFGIRPQIFDNFFVRAGVIAPVASVLPTVLCTFGTVFNKTSALLKTIVDAFIGAPYRLLVTCGPGFDRSIFRDTPANIIFIEALPLSQLLPVVDACITHGGTSTLTTILSAGKPALLLPQGADQKINAITCAQLTLAIAKFDAVAGEAGSAEPQPLGKMLITADTIRECVAQLLTNTSYRDNCKNLQQKIHALPDFATAVQLIEHVGAMRTSPVLPESSRN
jgi:hypothetical protein